MRRALAVFLLLCVSFPASAHIVASPDTGFAGEWFRTALRVRHGCDGSDTRQIIVTIPQDILIVKPQVKPGWTIDIKKRKLSTPIKGPHGRLITDTTDTITWTGDLPDAYFDEFGLTMKLPEKSGIVILPTEQICAKGHTNWTDKPGQNHSHNHGATPHPAPVITVTPAKTSAK